MAKKISLAILWHQHQPFYKDLKTGQAIMPWVRFHATKDYYDMAAILEEFPNVRVTINLVPSLLSQLRDFAQNQCSDPWLEKTMIPAMALSEPDKTWILENFFFCNWDTMIYPNPRFAELFEKRGKYSRRKEDLERMKTYFKTQDFLDLQVWFNLAWMDPLWREKDQLIAHLYKKGKQFSEGEKKLLMDKQREICSLVIAKHKELWLKGQIELSTTPFYHPILPLLCDTDSAQMAMPGSLKPKKRFQHPEDAKFQVEKALQFMENLFGKRPVGMWPSEGSVSEEAVSIMSDCGLKWAATDEAVLFRSLELQGSHTDRGALFQPYLIESGKSDGRLQMVFRDHALSDAIGFVYSRMDAHRAVDDFLHRITKISESLPDSGAPQLVSVILDGENCWEHYRNDGIDFLRALYGALSRHPVIETTTIGDFIQNHPAKNHLKKLWSGSWIGANFAIWIGHPEDNIAWDLLNETREFFYSVLKNHPEKSGLPETDLARESLLIAEGSDWCWWYGDQNSTDQDETFDELFRSHLKNVYLFLGAEPPKKLGVAIKKKKPKGELIPPVALITPKIDGLVTSFYEWRAGGIYKTESAGGTMHQAESFLSCLYYGFDLEKFYLRLDTKNPLQKIDLKGITIKVSFIEPPDCHIRIGWENNVPRADFIGKEGQTDQVRDIASNKIIELGVPFDLLQIRPNEDIQIVITISKDDIEMERWPLQSSISFKRPTEDTFSSDWSA